jgi:hypothetical protein
MTDLKRVTTPYSYSEAVAAGDLIFLGLQRGFGDDFYNTIRWYFQKCCEDSGRVW